jgi:hypothetical protein
VARTGNVHEAEDVKNSHRHILLLVGTTTDIRIFKTGMAKVNSGGLLHHSQGSIPANCGTLNSVYLKMVVVLSDTKKITAQTLQSHYTNMKDVQTEKKPKKSDLVQRAE